MLQSLMRIETRETTMNVYIGQDAQSTATELHVVITQTEPSDELGNLLGNPRPKSTKKDSRRFDVSPFIVSTGGGT